MRGTGGGIGDDAVSRAVRAQGLYTERGCVPRTAPSLAAVDLPPLEGRQGCARNI